MINHEGNSKARKCIFDYICNGGDYEVFDKENKSIMIDGVKYSWVESSLNSLDICLESVMINIVDSEIFNEATDEREFHGTFFDEIRHDDTAIELDNFFLLLTDFEKLKKYYYE